MVTTVYFIRHAHAPFSLENYHQRNLSEQGQKDALLIAEKLKNVAIDFFVSSSSPRAIETLLPLAQLKNKPIEQFVELQELLLRGPTVHLEPHEIDVEIKKVFETPTYQLPGGESRKTVEERGVTKYRELIKKYEGYTIALGTHGIIMTLILGSFDPRFNFEFWKNTSKPDVYKATFLNNKLRSTERLILN
jgi:2,3-bisphosphoglycerate-dependent phosphoglycerate mutase